MIVMAGGPRKTVSISTWEEIDVQKRFRKTSQFSHIEGGIDGNAS